MAWIWIYLALFVLLTIFSLSLVQYRRGYADWEFIIHAPPEYDLDIIPEWYEATVIYPAISMFYSLASIIIVVGYAVYSVFDDVRKQRVADAFTTKWLMEREV